MRILKQVFNFVKLFFHIIIYIIKLPFSILWFIAQMFYFFICKLTKNAPIIFAVFCFYILLIGTSMYFLRIDDVETFLEFVFLPFKVIFTHPFQYIAYLFSNKMPLNIFGGIEIPYLFFIPIVSAIVFLTTKLLIGFIKVVAGANEMIRDERKKVIPYIKNAFIDTFSSTSIILDIDAIRTNSRSHGRFYRL